jgi:hypothetical protein
MNRQFGLYTRLACMALLTWFALAPSSWVRAQNTQQQVSVVGSWVNTVLVNTPSGLEPFTTELLAINPGGTFVDTLTIAHSSQNPSFTGPFAPLAVEFSDAIGTWQPVGDSNQIALTFQRFLFAGPNTPASDYPTLDGSPFFPGQYVGVATIEAVGTLHNTSNGQILSGTYTFQLTNLLGINVLPGAKGTFSATRIQIQPLAP